MNVTVISLASLRYGGTSRTAETSVLARRDERRPFPDRGYGGRGHEHGAHTLLPGGEPLTEEGERTLNV